MRNSDCAFASIHPAICFTFFACALVLGMCFRHPVHLTIGLICSSLAYLSVSGRQAWRFLAALVPVFIIVAGINPIINTQGETILFAILGRPYTAESLLFGCGISAMLCAMLIWLACYTAVMTSDKHTYLFGGLAPAASLVFCMVLRLIPRYERRTLQMAHAREGIGASGSQDSTTKRLQNSANLVSGLTSWALEDAVVSADSMRARGYGAAPARSSYARYRMTTRDFALLTCIFAFTAASVATFLAGCANPTFFPTVNLGEPNAWLVASCIAYVALLLIPTIINLRESFVWRSSLSKM